MSLQKDIIIEEIILDADLLNKKMLNENIQNTLKGIWQHPKCAKIGWNQCEKL